MVEDGESHVQIILVLIAPHKLSPYVTQIRLVELECGNLND